MRARQRVPRQWLIVGDREMLAAANRLPLGSGVLLLSPIAARDLRLLRHVAKTRQLVIVGEGRGTAARVHDARELRRALLDRTPVILLSPIRRTPSHPAWVPLPRMRAAALARLGGRRLFALGGMNERHYATVARLGFIGWAGISAFRT
jgi:8-oxo-dGTP diphosphatase